ncbi:cephalotocin receptor 1-like [Anneissia japonica]|uniref:cephalotocin receptor 1-like n=1 Tax=Anneissia japonica TaxID=1529436 RepID=UPI0014259A5C|nr:cephalotocin receptor 1-like [Anneissia japonica]XP_033107565.1 cephalotocin receptor 1-like [Anneissia japonica]XP_033107566.1 cephalotocin receptor 1-like [Anneissia japonica]
MDAENLAVTDIPQTTSEELFTNNSTDIHHNVAVRVLTMWVIFTVGVIGNCLVLFWFLINRHRFCRRVNQIILGLTFADLCVCFFAVMGTAIYEMLYYHWLLGNVMCKIIMYLQSVSIMASSNLLVVIALDRHQAIHNPFRKTISTKKLVGIAWLLALLTSIPQLWVWLEMTEGSDATGYFKTCTTELGSKPSKRKAYVTYVAVVTFVIPFVIIGIAYIRICIRIWKKAKESENKPSRRSRKQSNRLQLQSTGTHTLIKAKFKTLKMTLVIVTFFFVCSLPYYVCELMVSFHEGDGPPLDKSLYAIFGMMAVSNSAVNPFIVLIFNLNGQMGSMNYCRYFMRRKLSDRSTSKVTTKSCLMLEDKHNGESKQMSLVLLNNSEIEH